MAPVSCAKIRCCVRFRAEKVGWMTDSKIRSGLRFLCKNQIFPVISYNTEPYYKRAMVKSNNVVIDQL